MRGARACTDVRELLVQTVAVLLQYGDYVIAFERNGDAQKHLIPMLLVAYLDARFWLSVTAVFLRLWKVCRGRLAGACRGP